MEERDQSGKACFKAYKKAIVIVEYFLTDGELPSGQTWEDLYVHILLQYEAITPKEAVFTGFLAFFSLTEYNDGGQTLSI